MNFILGVPINDMKVGAESMVLKRKTTAPQRQSLNRCTRLMGRQPCYLAGYLHGG